MSMLHDGWKKWQEGEGALHYSPHWGIQSQGCSHKIIPKSKEAHELVCDWVIQDWIHLFDLDEERAKKLYYLNCQYKEELIEIIVLVLNNQQAQYALKQFNGDYESWCDDWGSRITPLIGQLNKEQVEILVFIISHL